MSPVSFIFLFRRTFFFALIEERCWLYLSFSGHGSWLEHVTLSDSSFLLYNSLLSFSSSAPSYLACNVDPAIRRLESDGLRYPVVIFDDFGGNQSYADTYRYCTYLFPSFELSLCVFCILFMFGTFERYMSTLSPAK